MELCSFNGAETKMSRKLPHPSIVARTTRPLQWGRDKNVSEINVLFFFVKRVLCFNGAETKMSRKLNYGGWDRGLWDASMGPRQKCLGNSPESITNTTRCWLQWGRDKNVSEITTFHQHMSCVWCASMGPRQKCLGNNAD